ncbi:hypothetical protein S40288_10887 [Stachybotrys chartarum IBT 40288]|nr:hypothetical protein S40288_10887 [Stachybotrys chartarum IBT 40288]
MDWTPKAFLVDEGLDGFECDIQSDKYCTVLYKLDNDSGGDVQRLDLATDENWTTFEVDDAATGSTTLPRGVCILFCPRAPPPFPKFSDIRAELYEICMTEERWERIVDKFRLHSLLIKAILRKATSANTVVSDAAGPGLVDAAGSNNDVDNANVDDGRQPVVLHTIMTSPGLGDNFAMSSTHFIREDLSLAVFLGSTAEQVDQVDLLLQMGDEGIGHPYLVLGLCIELLLSRLRAIVETNVRDCIATTRRVLKEGRDSGKTPMGWSLIDKIRQSRMRSQQIKEEIETTKRHLHQVWPEQEGVDSAVAERFHDRFKYIMIELDGLLSRSQIYADEMIFNTNTMQGELTRLETNSSARMAQASVGLAIAAMLYLPMSTLATIFSMPVFNFENDWLDWRFQRVNGSSGSRDDPVGAASPDSAPVFSAYFWIWLVVAILLTLVTFGTFRSNLPRNTPQDAEGAVEDAPGSSQDNKSCWKHLGSLSATAIIRFLNIFWCKASTNWPSTCANVCYRDSNTLSPFKASKQSSTPPSSPARASGSAASLGNLPAPSMRNRQSVSPGRRSSRQPSQVRPDSDIEMVPVVTAPGPIRSRPPSAAGLGSNSRTQLAVDPGNMV